MIRSPLILCLVTSFACGNDATANPPGASPAPSGAVGHCEFEVTGAVQAKVVVKPKRTQDGQAMAASDYWLTDDSLRRGLRMLIGLGEKMSDADKARKVDEAMKRDPRMFALMVSCASDDGTVILGSGNMPYADLPFKPGKAAIPPANVMFSVGKHHYRAKELEVELTRFDRTGAAGTFVIKTGDVTARGKFDYPCAGDKCAR